MLHTRVPRRALAPRRQDLRHLRGHRRDPAAGDLARDLGDAHQVALGLGLRATGTTVATGAAVRVRVAPRDRVSFASTIPRTACGPPLNVRRSPCASVAGGSWAPAAPRAAARPVASAARGLGVTK